MASIPRVRSRSAAPLASARVRARFLSLTEAPGSRREDCRSPAERQAADRAPSSGSALPFAPCSPPPAARSALGTATDAVGLDHPPPREQRPQLADLTRGQIHRMRMHPSLQCPCDPVRVAPAQAVLCRGLLHQRIEHRYRRLRPALGSDLAVCAHQTPAACLTVNIDAKVLHGPRRSSRASTPARPVTHVGPGRLARGPSVVSRTGNVCRLEAEGTLPRRTAATAAIMASTCGEPHQGAAAQSVRRFAPARRRCAPTSCRCGFRR